MNLKWDFRSRRNFEKRWDKHVSEWIFLLCFLSYSRLEMRRTLISFFFVLVVNSSRVWTRDWDDDSVSSFHFHSLIVLNSAIAYIYCRGLAQVYVNFSLFLLFSRPKMCIEQAHYGGGCEFCDAWHKKKK